MMNLNVKSKFGTFLGHFFFTSKCRHRNLTKTRYLLKIFFPATFQIEKLSSFQYLSFRLLYLCNHIIEKKEGDVLM